MARSFALLLLLTLLVLATPLGADENDVAVAEAAVAKARERVELLKVELAGVYKEIEHDFELLRSDRFAALSAPYQDAVTIQFAALATEPGTDPAPALVAAFRKAGLLATVTSDRLAASVAGNLTADLPLKSPEVVLTDAVKVVFPKETFEECWEAAFLDLPAVLDFKRANDELGAAERRLTKAQASSGEKPEVPPGMVLVPRGRFLYGPWEGFISDLKANKQSKGRVAEAFFIDIHEVTNEDYLEFLSGVEDPELAKLYLGVGFSIAEDGSVKGPEGRQLWPVRGVTFLAAIAYAESIGKRLPTEEEWEKAARGEKGQLYPWGNEPDPEAANAPESGSRRPAPVGSFPKDKSPYGVMDMAGNVSELTSTLLDRRPYKGKLEGTEWIICRGGNYLDGEASTVAGYRRSMSAKKGQKSEIGFRCVISERAWKRQSR